MRKTMTPWWVHAINVKILILPNVSSIMYTVDNIIDLKDTPYGL